MTYEEALADLQNRVSLDINDGWVSLVVEAHQAILALEPENYKVHQIKEKFGGLRYYFSIDPTLNRVANEIIRAAEAVASKTCEVCGRPGHLRTERAWILTLCDQHNTENPIYIADDSEDDR